jgi:hypothetical protein
MSTPSDRPATPCTAGQIDDWIYATSKKRLDLHLLAAEPLYNTLREQAFMEMSNLLKEAIEEVRVVSASLRDESKALRAHAAELRERSAEIIERPTPLATPCHKPRW